MAAKDSKTITVDHAEIDRSEYERMGWLWISQHGESSGMPTFRAKELEKWLANNLASDGLAHIAMRLADRYIQRWQRAGVIKRAPRGIGWEVVRG